ncbi:hypothetical protein HAX54_010105 [Datura stramonium]|uniref:MADS-box domain-containing protein n=1 Tax=Datura stramonium TaxID=4076 RepID=A0ABS8THK0_DATST|nr:hypothetical protein [Datura stramonium]
MASKKFEETIKSSVSDIKILLYKRITRLFKKEKELSTLCDVQVGLIICSPREAISWPSETEARERVKWYFGNSKVVRMNKLVKNESYLDKMVKAREESIRKMKQKNGEKKMELLFNEVAKGKSIYELDAKEIKGLIKLFSLKKAKVDERKKQLQEHNQTVEANGNNAGEKADGHLKN